MYDGPTDEWLVRQTASWSSSGDLRTHVRRPHQRRLLAQQGHGRLRRLDAGTRDRSATRRFPILADGIKWLGYAPKIRLIWNLGCVRRLVLGGAGVLDLREPVRRAVSRGCRSSRRTGNGCCTSASTCDTASPRTASCGCARVPSPSRRRISSTPAKFAAKSTTSRARGLLPAGPLLIGSEYFFQKVDAPESGDPFFHGGEVS